MRTFEQTRMVTLLHPVDTGLTRFLELSQDEEVDPWEEIRAERLDETMEDVRQSVEEIAEDLHLRLSLYEYDIPKENGVPSRTATRWIGNSNVIAALEPTDRQLGFIISCMRKNPVISTLLSYSNENDLDEQMRFLGTQKTHIIGQNGHTQTRVFLMPTDRRNEKSRIQAIKGALLFPLSTPD